MRKKERGKRALFLGPSWTRKFAEINPGARVRKSETVGFGACAREKAPAPEPFSPSVLFMGLRKERERSGRR